MRTIEFEKWLLEVRELKLRAVQSRISNCRTVEKVYPDLDKHFLKDEGLYFRGNRMSSMLLIFERF